MSSRGQNLQEQPWSSGLCDCFSDCKSCCLTFWCPCVTFGRIAEIADEGSITCGRAGTLYALVMWLTGCGWILSCANRSRLRKQHMLSESPCNDCLVHCCCEHLALCQEYRELQHRGFDLSKGWDENMDAQRRGVAMTTAPASQGGMTK